MHDAYTNKPRLRLQIRRSGSSKAMLKGQSDMVDWGGCASGSTRCTRRRHVIAPALQLRERMSPRGKAAATCNKRAVATCSSRTRHVAIGSSLKQLKNGSARGAETEDVACV